MKKYIFLIIFSIFLTPLMGQNQKGGQLFEFHFGFFKPDIDSESSLTGTDDQKPYKAIFDNDEGNLFEFEWGIDYFNQYGTLSVSLSFGYFSVLGKGRYPDSGEKSEDETELSIMPIRLNLLFYTFDILQNRWNIPLVPYLKAGLTYSFWWITDGVGDIAEFGDKDGYGGKYGYHYTVGIKFLLDILDQDAALEFENDFGVTNSYIFLEYHSSVVDNFGGDGFNLGGNYWNFGIAITY